MPDYIIDAIDNIDSKVALLSYCYKNHLPIISSMGAGCKSDPTKVVIGDISASIEDPLSRATRRRLRALGIDKGIPVIYSTEKPGPGKAELLPLPEKEYAKGGVGELGVLPDFRVRILPVLGTMPAVFGNGVANHVILELAKYPHEYSVSKGREKLYESALASLQAQEERLAVWAQEDAMGLKIPLSKEDVGYLIEEVWRGRSALSGITTRLTLVRWRLPAEKNIVDKRWDGQKFSRLKFDDLVCMTKEEAVSHERDILKGGKAPEDIYDESIVGLVKLRMAEEASFAKYR